MILSENRIVVIGASAGGVEALLRLVEQLPEDFPAPIAIVLHVPPDSPSLLADILDRRSALTVRNAKPGDRLEPGKVYVAVPDHHLIVRRNGEGLTAHVARGPRENRHRPSVDPLFRSAAVAARENAIGVILSGTLDDGTAGLRAIKQCGGIAVVQEPSDALYPGMPQSAIENVDVDHVVKIAGLPALLQRLAAAPAPPAQNVPTPPTLRLETNMAELEHDALHADERPGKPSPYSCPDCGGVLWEIEEGEYVRFRCRVGHAFSPESMLGAQDELLEEALWSAVKTLEESARLSHRLAVSERQRGNQWLVKRLEEKEKEARERVEVIRRYLLRGESERAAGS